MGLKLVAVVVVVATLQIVWCRDNYAHDGASNFCRFVPDKHTLVKWERLLGSPALTDPIWWMRDCCDLTSGSNIVRCLDRVREKQLYIHNMYLTWREPENRDEIYREHLKECYSTYDAAKDANCVGGSGDICLDAVGLFEKYCSFTDTEKQSTEECRIRWPISVKHNAMAAFCIHGDYARETFHYKCFKEQAMNKKYQGVLDIQEKVNENCLNKNYGSIEVDWRDYMEYQVFKNANLLEYWNATELKRRAVFEHGQKVAYDYLDPEDICPDTHSYSHARECLYTPATQTLLTYKSNFTVFNEFESCCRQNDFNGKDLDGWKAKMKNCLEKHNLYQHFYPLGGLFMRSLYRAKTWRILECQNEKMFSAGNTHLFNQEISREEREQYQRYEKPRNFAAQFEIKEMITPVNYHFFLRNFSDRMSKSDPYLGMAVESCEAGRRLAKEAYVFPAILCPALTTKELYGEPGNKDPCDNGHSFYKFQVMHYCCLHEAVEWYNLGPEFNPKSCPQMPNHN